MKFPPKSIARSSAASDSLSSTEPHAPPIAQAPKLTAETFQPVRPNSRYCMHTSQSRRRHSRRVGRVRETHQNLAAANPTDNQLALQTKKRASHLSCSPVLENRIDSNGQI